MVNLSRINEQEKPKNICSIDASTNSLAFAIFSDNSLIRYGKINFQGKNTYSKIADAASKTIALFRLFDIDAIVIEHTVFINSPKTAADLALVQGALLGAASLNRIKIAGSINPITWQSYIGNNKLTSAEKQQLMKEYPAKSKNWYANKSRDIRKLRTIHFVNTYYDKSITDNDVADAIGIGHWAINNWGKVDK
jgi:Holliday junction resolvasome RuvABC endonuclease subunit